MGIIQSCTVRVKEKNSSFYNNVQIKKKLNLYEFIPKDII
jgi:hypothetical protein